MEEWNIGMLEKKGTTKTHYSIIPSFHFFSSLSAGSSEAGERNAFVFHAHFFFSRL